MQNLRFDEAFLNKKAALEAKWAKEVEEKQKKQKFCNNCGQPVILRATRIREGLYRGWHKADLDGQRHNCPADEVVVYNDNSE